MKKTVAAGVFCILCLLIPAFLVVAADRGCGITSFTLNPGGSEFNMGDVIALNGTSNCGTVRFEIDREPKSEIGSTNQSMNMNTAEFGAGQHDVCFVARGEGGWENADRSCVKITIKENKPKCQITGFGYSPKKDVYAVGDVIDFHGQSTCGTVKYTVEGNPVNELGSSNLDYQFKTGEWGKETYTVCFMARGDGGWESADKRCGTIFVGTDPGLPAVYPQDPGIETNEGGESDSSKQSGTSSICQGDHATLVADLSIPDGTKMLPGEIFTKTWRMKNDGNCTWNRNYSFTSVQGDRMGGRDQNIAGTVNPGETIDISVKMQAPSAPGNVKTLWAVTDPANNVIKSRVYVEIEVVDGASDSQAENSQESIDTGKKSLDIQGYCQSKGYDSAFANKPNTANSWICTSSKDQSKVDLNEVCKFTNGDEFSKAVAQDETNPDSWYCEKSDEQSTVPSDGPVIASLEINQLDFADSPPPTTCGKQCVDLIREEYPASKHNEELKTEGWGVLDLGSPAEWYAVLKDYRGKDYPNDDTGSFVYVRGEFERPMPGDIIVWNAWCEGAEGAGHTGIVAGFEPDKPKDKGGVQRPLRVNDYNWGKPLRCWKNNPRTYNPSCTLFLMPYSASVSAKNEAKEQKNQEDNPNPTITQPGFEDLETKDPVKDWICETFKFFCDK